jgi:hypothetical protein
VKDYREPRNPEPLKKSGAGFFISHQARQILLKIVFLGIRSISLDRTSEEKNKFYSPRAL